MRIQKLPDLSMILAGISGLFVLAMSMCLSSEVSAQTIRLKTAPVATGHQFFLQPSVNAGMGGISIAQDDTLGDSFVNPAKSAKVRGTRLYSLPMFYRIADGYGSAGTLTAGGLSTGEQWFGGLGVAVQEMTPASNSGNTNYLKDESANNNYIWIQGGKSLNSPISVGASLFWASLGAMEGVDLLYPRSQRIDQHGKLIDVRFGLQGETNTGGQYEALALFARTDMTHEVTYLGVADTWFRVSADALSRSTFVPQQTVEVNQDITHTWGLHLGYDRGFGENNWNTGAIFTFNYKTHPKIPNYELMNIPRDPGNSYAFNFGVGTSTISEEKVIFGFDLIFEPIWSHTWVEAEEEILSADESKILVDEGGKTIENDFEFLNSLLKAGIGWQGTVLSLQTGIQAKTYRYHLKQQDHIQGLSRNQREHWTEWTLSMSVGARLGSLKLTYTGILNTGTGQPGIAGPPAWVRNDSSQAAGFTTGDFIFAPSGDLALESASILTHQVSVVIAI